MNIARVYKYKTKKKVLREKRERKIWKFSFCILMQNAKIDGIGVGI